MADELRNYNQSNLGVTNVIPRIQNRGIGIGVAGVSSDQQTGNMLIQFSIEGRTKKIDTTSHMTEALFYPLFFPYGEDGWSTKLQKEKKINFMPYLASRILKPETGLVALNQNNEPIIVNRFQLMARLMQYYVIESVSRATDYRLQWHKNNKSMIFGIPQGQVNEMDEYHDLDEPNDEIIDGERNTNNNSDRTYLAESFTGSPRHLRSLAIDAMTIVTELGESTAFVTATFNTTWPELKDMLLHGQTIYDRPDIACQVFKARLKALIHNIKHGKYFGGRKTVYFLYVIEYQFRGLPHAHIVFKLENGPVTQGEKLQFIDTFFKAKYPEPFQEKTAMEIFLLNQRDTNDYNKNKAEHEQYVKLISDFMVHTCSASVNGCKDKNGFCKRGFMTTSINTTNSFDEKGYPVYHRPNEADLKVVAHNKEILLDWKGHINVEFCGKTHAVMYLYNYLFKGIIITNQHIILHYFNLIFNSCSR